MIVIADVKKYEHWVVLGVIGSGALAWLVYFLRKRRRDRAKHLPEP